MPADVLRDLEAEDDFPARTDDRACEAVSGDGWLIQRRSTISLIVAGKKKSTNPQESPQRWWAEKFVVPIVVAILGAGGVSAIVVAVIQHEKAPVVQPTKSDAPGIHYFTAYLNPISNVSEYSINLYVGGQLAGTFSGDSKTHIDTIKSSVPSLGQHNYNFTGQLKLTTMDQFTFSAYGSGTISIMRDGDMLEAGDSGAAPVASSLWFELKHSD